MNVRMRFSYGKMRLMKPFTGALLMMATILMASAGNPVHAEIIDGIVAVVDDQVVMYSDLLKKMHDLGAKENDDKTTRQVLQLMVEDVIVKKVYKSIGLPPVDLKQAEDVAGQMNIDVGSAQSFIMKSTLMDIMVKSRVVVTEAMIRSYYENNKEYVGKEAIHMKQILIRKDTAKAQRALEEIRKGTPFDEVAKNTSDALTSGSPDIGWVAIDDMADEIRKELEAAQTGAVVGPVTLGDNILIYQVEERGKAGGKPLAEVRDQIVTTLQEKYRNEAFQHWLKTITAEHFVGIFI